MEPIITSSIKQFIGLILLPDRERFKKERVYVPAFSNSDCSINVFYINVTAGMPEYGVKHFLEAQGHPALPAHI